jgi:hypothetical protein
MKKILLSLFAGAFSLGVTAQVNLYTEDFEGATAATYSNATTPVAIAGLTGWEFSSTQTSGSLQTNLVGNSGSQSLAMWGSASWLSPDPENSAILTYDLSAYTVTSDSLQLEFSVRDNNDENDFGDRVWIRGNSTAAWVEVANIGAFFNFPQNNPCCQWFDFSVDMTTALNNAGQDYSSTFQVRFGQMDNATWFGGDGLAYDDVRIDLNVLSVNFVDGNYNPCFNDSNGFLDAAGSFGTPPYTYAWSTGATTASLTNLAPGTYTVTVTDDLGDTASNTAVLVPTDSIFADQTILTQLVCKYDDAAAQVSGSGGESFPDAYSMDTNSVNYAWDSAGTCNTVSFGSFSNQVSGFLDIGFDFEFYGQTYDQFQLASNGYIGFGGGLDNGCCSAELLPNTSTFEPNNAIFATWYDVDGWTELSYCWAGEAPFRRLIVNFVDLGDCFGDNNTTAQIILHETTNCIEIQTDFQELNGCFNTFDIATQGMQNQGGTEFMVYPGRNATNWTADDSYVRFCPVDSTGLLYTWDDGRMGQLNDGLSAGTYTVSVEDAFGCILEEEVVIADAPSTLTLDPIVSDVTCFSFADASIQSNQTGGVAPIVYSWSSGQTSADLNNIGGGMYTVMATDNLGCVDSAVNIYVDEAPLLISSINAQSSTVCPDDGTGSATVVATGGRMPYTYEWSDGQLGNTASSLDAGSYLVTVTDSSGCESVQTVNITAENESPVVDLGVNYLSTSGVGITLDAGTYAQYLWSTGETTQTIHVGQTGTYWAQATNAAGCSGSDTVYVEIWPNGINEEDGSSIMTLFPNPTTDRLTLDLQGGSTLKDVTVTVTDIQGRTILQDAFMTIEPNAPVSIDVNALTPGTYNLSVRSDNVNIVRGFVKQ